MTSAKKDKSNSLDSVLLNSLLYKERKITKNLLAENKKLNQELYAARRRLRDLDRLYRESQFQSNTIAFQIGKALLEARTSLSSFIKLPITFYKISQESKRRKEIQKEKKLNKATSQTNNKQVKPIDLDKQKKKLDELIEKAEKLPETNGSQYYQKLDYSVAIITDVFMFNYYNNIFKNTFYVTPKNYKEVFENNKIDMFLYVSCWEGINDEEWRGITYREKPKNAFEDILEICKAKKIKTAFQTIEDPSNYERFLPLAKQFNYVFTTDVEKIDDYKKDCKHQNVFYGEFGANPLFNNPVGLTKEKIKGAFFAGSYPSRYKDRCDDMHTIFDSIIKSKNTLYIANRNSDRKEAELQFPSQYNEFLIPKMEHGILQKVHKLFQYNINFNSIKHSPTMCAMRVYELQAQGSQILSNYAKSVNNKFPNIDIINAYEDMNSYFNPSNEFEEYENQIIAIRKIMTDKTGFDICSNMLSNVGLIKSKKDLPKVLVIADKLSAKNKKSFANQKYPNCELFSKAKISTVKPEEYTYVTFFNSDYEYEAYYINDMVNGFKYTDSKYITKAAYFASGNFNDAVQHDFTDVMPTIFRSVFDAKKFKLNDLIALPDNSKLEGGYAIDPFELNYLEYCETQNKKAKKVKPKLSVIVPIYNNGEFLVHKCIKSLRRNKLFPEMEILLVDDGSSDEETISIINDLERKYSNIKTHFFPKGGSGSASRPRNKGVELASCKLLTFLDPDNEISPQGYDNLLEIYEDQNKSVKNIDFVSGYQMKVGKNSSITGRNTNKKVSLVNNPAEAYLKSGKFPVVSTQAAIIRRETLIDAKLDYVVGSIGQDTLYGHELLCASRKAVFTNDAHIIYYADRSDSVTNIIGKKFFEKSLVLEKEQFKRFKKHGVLAEYIEYKFDYFFRNWYMEKLKNVGKKDKKACEKILVQILDIYGFDKKVYF